LLYAFTANKKLFKENEFMKIFLGNKPGKSQEIEGQVQAAEVSDGIQTAIAEADTQPVTQLECAADGHATENDGDARDSIRHIRRHFLFEDTGRRERNGKHYVGNDGTSTAIFSDKAMHYLDPADNQLKDIDNSLTDTGDGYETKANGFKTRFKKHSAGGEVFEMSKGGCKVGLVSREAAEKGGCQLENCDCGDHAGEQSEVVLHNVKDNVDIQYIVDSDRVKENIVIKEKADNYEYNFDINIENLTVGISEDGKTLELKNAEGETQFFIPGPFMTDANGEYSDLVYYEIGSQNDNTLNLKVFADAEWLNAEGRAFPVVIDPQIISGDTNLFAYQNYYRSMSSSSSGTNTLWSLTSYSYIRAGISGITEYKCDLTIKKSKMNLSGNKILKAKLRLRVYSLSGCSYCYINGNFVALSSGAWAETDITSIFKSYSSDFTIPITNPYSGIACFHATGVYAPVLEVEYVTNENTRPTVQEFSLAGCATGYLNLSTGEVTASFADADIGGSALSLTVSHHYKQNSAETNFGKNWRLNLEQKLEKNTDTALDANYIYTDAAGDKHGFKDVYYYLNSANNKVDVTAYKAQITVGQDGRLAYNGYEVLKEQKTSSGLKAVTTLDGFKNVELIEQRHEEQIELEDALESYRANFKDLTVVNMADGSVVRSLTTDKPTKAQFDTFMNMTATQMVLPKGEAINLKNMRLQYKTMTLQDTSMGLQKDALGQQISGMELQLSALDTQKQLLDYQNESMEHQISAIDCQIESLANSKESIYLQRTHYYDSYFSSNQVDTMDNLDAQKSNMTLQQTDITNQLGQITPQKDNLTDQQTNLNSQKTTIIDQQTNLSEQRTNVINQRTNLSAQITYTTGKRAAYIEQVNKLFKEYTQTEYRLSELYKQLPVNYLIDGNNVVSSFNRDGKLIAVYDAYENTLSIEYDIKDRIAAVYEGEEKKLSFHYNDYNQLTSITDARGRKTNYTYSGTDATATLNTVTYADGRKITFAYDIYNSDDITAIESSDKLKTALTYEYGRPKTIIDYSLASGISKSGDGGACSVELGRKTIDSQIYRTDITDEKGKKACYVFNADGNVSLNYTEQDGVLEDAYTRDFVSSNCMLTVKAKKSGINRLAGIGTLTKSTAYSFQTIPGSTLDPFVTDYMFGAYATAKSNTTGMRMKTAFYQQNMATTVAAKFELRADVEYSTGTKQFIVPFDYANKNRQYAALPVTLDEDANGNAVMPTQIKLYVDYSSNSGSAVFDAFTFQEAEWEYKLLDQFGNPTLSETNWEKLSATKRAKSVTVYTYDDEQRLVKERVEQRTATVGGNIVRKYAVTEYAYNPQGSVSRVESYVEGEAVEKGISVTETFYDEKGHQTKEVKYNSLDGTTKFYSESEVSEKGVTLADIDESGENKTRYEYIDGTNVVKGQILPNGSKFGYGRGEYDEVTGITQSTETGEENSTQIRHDFGLVTELKSGNNTAEYVYDNKRRKKQVKLNGASHVIYTYENAVSGNGYIDKVTATLADGTAVETRTDRKGNVLTVKADGSPQVTNTYDTDGRLLTSTDNVQSSTLTNTYDTEFKDRLTGVTITAADALSEAYTYNAYGQNEQRNITHGGDTLTYAFEYKNNASRDLEYAALPNGLKVYPQTDVNGRGTGKLVTDESGAAKYGEYVYYRKVGAHGTNQVSSIRYGVNGNVSESLKYAYDNMGNIAEVWENGLLAVRYGYDALNRLTREDNKALNKTYLWAYDGNGNILSKRETGYTRKAADEIDEYAAERLYSYIGDRLTGIKVKQGETETLETFDWDTEAKKALGTPATYRDKALTWQKGTQLASCDGVTFAYDGYGRRISKGNTQYIYDANGKLFRQISGSDILTFLYDGAGLSGIRHTASGTTADYLYRKNAQGDITHILDTDGNIVVQYTYDAWGNYVVTQDTNGLAEINPYRYRGYYYDIETGLYYLQSRYYDPEAGRFISQDDVSYIDSEHINGLNLYAYCLNNPVCYSDPSGKFPILALIIGIVIIVTALWENGKGFTNGHLEGNQYYTTVNWFGIDIATYTYTIMSDGYVIFSYLDNPHYNFGTSIFLSDMIAESIYYQVRAMDANFLSGRSIGGIQLELISHHFVFATYPHDHRDWDRAKKADIKSYADDVNALPHELFGGFLNLWHWSMAPLPRLYRRIWH
jgi:RHS repeat-associated protein